MKKSELKKHEKIAYEFYLEYIKGHVTPCNDQSRALLEYGKEIAGKLESELKPVDMSALVDTGIDCVFEQFDEGFTTVVGELSAVMGNEFFLHGYPLFDMCKPRMGYWFSALNFDGSRTIVNFLRDAGFNIEEKFYPDCICAIEAFKITGLKDGYCWPWECE